MKFKDVKNIDELLKKAYDPTDPAGKEEEAYEKSQVPKSFEESLSMEDLEEIYSDPDFKTGTSLFISPKNKALVSEMQEVINRTLQIATSNLLEKISGNIELYLGVSGFGEMRVDMTYIPESKDLGDVTTIDKNFNIIYSDVVNRLKNLANRYEFELELPS